MGSAQTPNWPDTDSVIVPMIEEFHKITNLFRMKFGVIRNVKILKRCYPTAIINFIIYLSNETIFAQIPSCFTKLCQFEMYHSHLIFHLWNRQKSQLSQGEVNHQLRQFSWPDRDEHGVYYWWMKNAPAVQIWRILMVI